MPRPRTFSDEAVVDAAIEQFQGSSFSATSTEELCQATGLSRSSLYNAFHSKSQIYAAALTRYDERMCAERSGCLEHTGTGRELLEELLRDSVQRQFATADRRTCLALAASMELGAEDPEIAAIARHNLQNFTDTITELIERGQCDGSITSELPAADLARMVHAMLSGLQVVGRVADDDRTIQATIDTALQLLC